MAKMPKRITYGIVAINDRQIPHAYQIPIITAHLRAKIIPERVSIGNTACVSVRMQVRTERRKSVQSMVILAGRIYNFICRACRIKYSLDLKLGEMGIH